MMPELMRLHITPFNPDLLKVVAGPHLLDSISDISYHTVQTFPEKDYGYLGMPSMEGEKLKKKLNGTILKGKKVKIEEARPKKRRRTEKSEQHDASEEPKPTTATKSKKPKKEHNVIAGRELSPDRKVKRGWTEGKTTRSSKRNSGKDASVKSKYTEKDELLFRTNLPPNKANAVGTNKKEKGKSKKKTGEHTVHEFERSTTQPSFLKQEVGLGINGGLQYVDGQGWADQAGNVVEKEHEGIAHRRQVTRSQRQSMRTPTNRAEKETPRTSVSSSSADEAREALDPSGVAETEETSSSGSSSASSDEETDGDVSSIAASNNGETNDISGVHPLEALFKKPSKPASQDVAKPSLEISTAFSFFDASNSDDLEEEPTIPLTPFSSQEFRSRGLRSAAPTPDTAYPSRFNSYGSTGLPGDEEMEEDDRPPRKEVISKARPLETPPQTVSEFEKKFWENRAENNRSWKLRRRTVLKEKRQRENKARRPKNW